MNWSTLLGVEERALVFDIVRVSVWADGRLSADELAAARGIATALDVLWHPRVRGSLSRGAGLAPRDVSRLGSVASRVAFAAAAWIVWIDGEPTPSENALLEQLATSLRLDDDDTAPIVREVARSVTDIRRAGSAAMSAEDWAIEIDGLLAWTALFAVDTSFTPKRTRPSGAGRGGLTVEHLGQQEDS